MKAFLLLWIVGIGTCCAWPYLKNAVPAGNPVITAIVNDIKGLTSSKAPTRSESPQEPTVGAIPAVAAAPAGDAIPPATRADQVRSKLGEPTRISENGRNGEIWYYPTTIVYLGNNRVIQTQCVAATPFPTRARVFVPAVGVAGNWPPAPNMATGPFDHGAYRTGGTFVGRGTSLNSVPRVGTNSVGSVSVSRPVYNPVPRAAATSSASSSSGRATISGN